MVRLVSLRSSTRIPRKLSHKSTRRGLKLLTSGTEKDETSLKVGRHIDRASKRFKQHAQAHARLTHAKDVSKIEFERF